MSYRNKTKYDLGEKEGKKKEIEYAGTATRKPSHHNKPFDLIREPLPHHPISNVIRFLLYCDLIIPVLLTGIWR